MEDGLDEKHNVKVEWKIRRMFAHLSLEIRCLALTVNNHVIQTCSPDPVNRTTWAVGTICQAVCNETGYRLIGPGIRQCLSVGHWTGYEQFCIGRSRSLIGSEGHHSLFKSVQRSPSLLIPPLPVCSLQRPCNANLRVEHPFCGPLS